MSHTASIFALVGGAAAWLLLGMGLRSGAAPHPAAAAYQARLLLRQLAAAALLALTGLGPGRPHWLLAALGATQAGLAAAIVLPW